MLICKFCNKECKNSNSLRNHERLCKENPERQITYILNKKIDDTFTGKCNFCNKHYTNKSGLSNHVIRCKENPNRKIQLMSENGKENIREHNRNRKESGFYSEEYRKKMSNIMKQVVLDNPDSYSSNNVCGRIKIQDYKGEKFHGKWELEVAKWFDEINVKWERKIEPIKYYWNNDWHLYFPDFYLPDYDLYVEVKGYETDRDTAKWNSLSNLKVLKNKEISLIKERKYPPVTHW